MNCITWPYFMYLCINNFCGFMFLFEIYVSFYGIFKNYRISDSKVQFKEKKKIFNRIF